MSTSPTLTDIAAIDLEAIAARCEAATPGPWEVLSDQLVDTVWLNAATPEDDKPIALFDYRPGGANRANADFIAHARQDVPVLLAAMRSMQQRIQDLLEANNREIKARVEAKRQLEEAMAKLGPAARVVGR
jgi:hypothetical protein